MLDRARDRHADSPPVPQSHGDDFVETLLVEIRDGPVALCQPTRQAGDLLQLHPDRKPRVPLATSAEQSVSRCEPHKQDRSRSAAAQTKKSSSMCLLLAGTVPGEGDRTRILPRQPAATRSAGPSPCRDAEYSGGWDNVVPHESASASRSVSPIVSCRTSGRSFARSRCVAPRRAYPLLDWRRSPQAEAAPRVPGPVQPPPWTRPTGRPYRPAS